MTIAERTRSSLMLVKMCFFVESSLKSEMLALDEESAEEDDDVLFVVAVARI